MIKCDKCGEDFNTRDERSCSETYNFGRECKGHGKGGVMYFLCPECNSFKNRHITVGELIDMLSKFDRKKYCVLTQGKQLVNIRKVVDKSQDVYRADCPWVMLLPEESYVTRSSEHNEFLVDNPYRDEFPEIYDREEK